jgi:hypothetical protein
MFEKLKSRWNVKSNWDIVVILLVFSLAGSTSLYIKQPVFLLFDIQKDLIPTFDFVLIYILVVNPSYLFLLLFWGFVLRKWEFFWTFEKRIFKKIFILEIVAALVYSAKIMMFS